MKTLRELLEERENVYITQTNDIFEIYGDKLKKVFSYVFNLDRYISWLSIEPYGDYDNLVVAF